MGDSGDDDDSIPAIWTGFRITFLFVFLGTIIGLSIVGLLYVIHESDLTKRMLITLGVIVIFIFFICMKRLPKTYSYSLLCIAMLIAALGTGFVLDLGTPFKFLSGALAIGAAVIKGMFY
jgi:hypothetical protein